MQQLVPDIATELLSIFATMLGSVFFTGIGILGEQAGVASVMTGKPTLGAWELFIGSWALFVGVYLLGVKQVIPRLRKLVAE